MGSKVWSEVSPDDGLLVKDRLLFPSPSPFTEQSFPFGTLSESMEITCQRQPWGNRCNSSINVSKAALLLSRQMAPDEASKPTSDSSSSSSSRASCKEALPETMHIFVLDTAVEPEGCGFIPGLNLCHGERSPLEHGLAIYSHGQTMGRSNGSSNKSNWVLVLVHLGPELGQSGPPAKKVANLYPRTQRPGPCEL